MILLAQEVTMIPPWMQGSVGLMAALMILRTVFAFIDRREGKRQNGNGGVAPGWAREPLKKVRDIEEDVSAIRTKTKDLHIWHAPENGVQEWKNKQLTDQMSEFKVALETAATRSTKALENNTRVMERLLPILQGLES